MNILRHVVLGACVLGATCLAVSSVGADDRAPVPSSEEIAKAEELIRDLFKADYAKARTADRIALATKLLQQAKDTKDDPGARYVLLREARDIAAKVGEAALAMEAAGEMAAGYQVGVGAVRAAAADKLVAATSAPTAAATLAEMLLSAASAARTAGDAEGELDLLKAAESAARKSRNVPLVTTARNRLKGAEAFKTEAEKVKPHLDTLKTKPDDAEANFAVGRFRCLFKNDWEAGLPNLLKGSDEGLKGAAEKDKQAAEGGDTDQVAAGDVWYDLAAKADPEVKAAMQARAHHWYSGVVANLTGLTKARVEKRLGELAPATEVTTDKPSIWGGIRKAVAEGSIKKGNIVGGGFFRKPYTEIPEDGAILIGFYYSTIGGGKYPGAVQPIWLTASGEVKGKPYGVVERGARIQVTRAKPGYAVGALYTRGGGGFDQFKPIYMKIKGGGLDTEDKYDGPQVGGEGGSEGTLGGDGYFIVGIHGKYGDKNNNMGCLSIVSLTAKVGEDKPK
jgi:hypothetical protein